MAGGAAAAALAAGEELEARRREEVEARRRKEAAARRREEEAAAARRVEEVARRAFRPRTNAHSSSMFTKNFRVHRRNRGSTVKQIRHGLALSSTA